MTVTTTSPVAGVTRTSIDQSTKLSAALNTSATTNSASSSNSNSVQSSVDDTSSLSQSPTVSLRLAALNVALAGSNTDTLDSGAAQVQLLLGQLQSLATQASAGNLSQSALEQLNGQFQALRLAINNVPPGPPNNETPVSSLTQNVPLSTADSNAVVGGFNDKKLLGDANLTSQANAQAASQTVSAASTKIDTQRVVLAQVQSDIDFNGASVNSALQNQEALQSTLTASDLTGGSGNTLVASLVANPTVAVATQTSKLPDNILQLLQQ